MSTTPTRPGRLVVIGVGHRDRADDGIGPAVVDALSHRTDDDVYTIVREGDLAVLPLLWEADDDVVIVDANVSAGPIGDLRQLDADDLASSAGMSTHGLKVADAVQLAARLGCMPARLRVFGIGGRDFGYGPMSHELHHLVDPLTDELMALLGVSHVTSPGRSGETGRRIPG